MSAMSNGNGKMRYEELQASLTSLPNGASGADASDFDAICNLTAKLYLQLNSKRPEAASGERETANRRAYLRDVTEHVQRRFDATVNTMKLDAGACERPEETAGRGTQSRMVARLQRLFKRSQTVGDEASVPATHPAVVCSRSYAPQVALSSVEDSSNSTSSGNTGTGSSALSNDARGATVKQADVLLCVTDLGGLLRPKRSKFSRVHAMLRRDERDHVLEFYAPNSGTNTNANANATGKRAPPKHGIICRLIDTLRFTTCFELQKNQTALLIKIDIGVVYLLTTEEPGALTEWYDVIERCCALDRSQSPDRHVTLSSRLEVDTGVNVSESVHGRRTRAGFGHSDAAAMFSETTQTQTHSRYPIPFTAERDTFRSRRPKRSRSAGAAHPQSGSGLRVGSSASLLRGDEDSDDAFGEQQNAGFEPSVAPDENENENDTGCNLRRVARRLEQIASSSRRDVQPDEATLDSVDRYVDEEVARFGWFHGALPRDDAARLVCTAPLPSDGRNGVWLVRRSESMRGQLVLTFTWNGKAKHVRICLLADGACCVQSYASSAFPHVTSVLEQFASTGMVPIDHAQPPRGDLDRPFGDFAIGVPAASPRIVLGRFVANLTRFTDADKMAFGVPGPPSENAGKFATIAPTYISKRLGSESARTPSLDEPSAPVATQNTPYVPQTSTSTATSQPPSSSAGSKTIRAICNNYSFT